ncbi:unnamed protein product [Prorocentrum cordatum]|uniref:Uncharacterized protein n=1 Tax=Prorocentrum cordatum TaxID=2364126 RepID=A0ABN9SSY1_9DINO|nr:unnamed protein product [Polarella glacialis]
MPPSGQCQETRTRQANNGSAVPSWPVIQLTKDFKPICALAIVSLWRQRNERTQVHRRSRGAPRAQELFDQGNGSRGGLGRFGPRTKVLSKKQCYQWLSLAVLATTCSRPLAKQMPPNEESPGTAR